MNAMTRIVLLASLLGFGVVAAAGCYTEESYGYAQPAYGYAQPAYGEPAAVGYVGVAPGVEVVADYDYPVFFVGGIYWRSFGGVWYSSRVYNGGWGINYNVPMGIRGIARPEMYDHYHPAGASIRYNGGVGARGYVGARGGAVARPGYNAAGARPAYSAPAARPAAAPARAPASSRKR
jgi:hypothetical protein